MIEFSDGTFGFLGDDGWVDEFDAIETPELETTAAFGVGFIDIDAASVIDTALAQRIPFVGPTAPVDLPVELVERIADAVREWADQ
ncbi:hypothetical protein [Nocardia sp. CA-120079]|uniref:hypothetical protein n=1 Tax=Nocardia sp. CA-120079 TaxID=3239974 RepID=UPI003D988C17